MQVTVTKNLNIRSGSPYVTDNNNIGYYKPGDIVKTDSTVVGQNIQNNSTWYKVSDSNNYIWSGGISSQNDSLQSLPGSKGGVNSPSGNAMIDNLKIADIWNTGELGDMATVAILDSGVALTCSDLIGAVNEGIVPGQNASLKMNNFVTGSNTMDDDVGHGSHCAGLIASRNQQNIIGIAPKCKLYIGKISDLKNNPTVTNMISGIQWAASIPDIDIISISNGSLLNIPDMQPAIDAALKNNKIVISSIGNRSPGGMPQGGNYPAICNGSISVGAVDLNNQFLDFNYEYNNLTICCPGLNITSYWISGNLQVDSGTSQSTAICAGIIALFVSKMKKKNVSNIPAEIIKLLNTSSSLLANDGFSYRFINPSQLYKSI